MNLVSGVQTVVALVLAIGSLGLTGFALADVVRRRGTLFPHAGRLSKGAWLGILIAAFLIALLSLTQALATGSAPLGLLNIAGVIAAGVYLADVKPKLKQLGGGNTNNDPYGKW